jgi:hypothetical protein
MEKPQLADVVYSIGVKAPVALVRAGIGAPKQIYEFSSRKPVLAYCLISLAVLWGIGLLFACQPLEAWQEFNLNRLVTILTMCLVLGIITIFSLFPAAIYAAFTREDMKRARERTQMELEHHNMEDLKDEVNECFNTAYDPKTYRLPVTLATVVMIFCWVLFFFSRGAGEVGRLASSGDVSTFFVNLENAHPVVFGFLGAFFFSLQTLLRRYFTADLKASVFMHIAVRTCLVMILVLVLSTVWEAIAEPGDNEYWGKPALLAICFLSGIIPDIALDLIQRAGRAGLGKVWKRVSYSDVSLIKIQGLNLWHQARLAEEGIDNVQNLAKSDIIGLIVNTRLGLMRVLDWVDQALLYIHAGEHVKNDHVENDFDKYCQAGIHTATELEAVYMGRHQPERSNQENEREAKLEMKMKKEGRCYVPPVPPGLAEMLGNEPGLQERVYNEMIAICDDVNFQRLSKLRHQQMPLKREKQA